ncbi:MAG: LamG-like jellyroll fold domain-containing protein [Candidatus Paceibacterota bacterium]|jgi:prepilin-type N-terminal cleavage/methylation domain-containing protein
MNKLIKQAFTLIELLVVIAIVGILSGLIVVSMSGVTQKANIAKAQVFSNSLRNSLMLNLIAEYKLDSNANDSWGGHLTGSVSGASVFATCIQNSCYNFSASGNYIELTDSPDLRMTTGGTISVWIYPRSVGNGNNRGRIIDKGVDEGATSGYNIRLFDSNSVRSYVNYTSDTVSSTNVIIFNQWQLVTVVFSTAGGKIYINGIDKTASGGTVLPSNIAGIVRIGNAAYSASYTFDGYIDEVRIYNVVMPAFQIKEQYYIGLNKLLASGGITRDEYKQKIGEVGTLDN